MIDWSKVGPANSPTPTTPDTTAPIPSPGSGASAPLFGDIPQAGALGLQAPTDPTGQGFHPMSQEEVNQLDPGQRIARGIDFLGEQLFGRGNGSPLGGVPLLGDIVGGAGNALHAVGKVGVAPFEIAAHVASRVPLGWLPGGADDNFNQIGQWAKDNNAVIYQQWQAVNAAANGDVLGGGNLKADFNIEFSKMLDDASKEGFLGTTPDLAIGRAGVGSLGGAFSHAVQGWLGLASNTSQRFLGSAGVFDPTHNLLDSGKLNRVEESAARLDAGGEISDIEKKAVEAWRSGEWSLDHAQDYIVSHGQGVTRNIIGQIVGTALTDPLTYATVGAGAIAKAGVTGARLANVGAEATTAYEKLGAIVNSVQKSEMGPIFRIARGLIDPLAVYKPSSVERATTDLLSGVATESFRRAHGQFAVQDVRALAREFDKVNEVDSAIASYSMDKAYEMVAAKAQRDMLAEGLGEEFVHTNVDDVIQPLAQQAGRDAVTELTDHMMSVAKNTFTAEEEASLAGRMAATFGKDVPYWEKRLASMSHDVKSALHAVTYKRAEVEFEQARAAVDTASYTGDLPLRNAVLMTSDTLDDVTAEQIIDNIRSVLKDENTPDKIAAATSEWNAQARRYPTMANLGYATGGKDQVEALVKELESTLQSGGITRRALDEELNDGTLRPIRDMLDRHSMPTGLKGKGEPVPGYAITSTRDEAFKRWKVEVRDAEGNRVAEAVARDEGNNIQVKNIFVDEAHRRQGIANWMYTKLEKDSGKTLVPDTEQLADGKALWEQPGGRPFGEGASTPSSTRPLWKVGFRPDEEVAWGLKRDANTGRWVADRAPTISHVVDAVPGRQPFSDTTRNVLGQIIGKSKAERINGPIDSIEAFVNTSRDVVTGRRLVKNIEQRFERSTFDAGIPKPLAKDIFTKAREVAALDYTTIRGIAPKNLWDAIHEIVPRDLVLKDGSTLNIHIVMDHLLQAAEGDLRIMGVTSVLSQRMRNRLRQLGDGSNMAGQLTVSLYNKLRYSFNPTFIIQRITDAPYYSILYGVVPVGKGALTGAKAELAKITENLGRTGLARHFSMDMPEYATRANFTAGIKSQMQQMGLKENRLQKIIEAPDTIIANNMVNMLHARLGNIVRGTLDNLATAAEKADPAFQAEMLQAGEALQRSFDDWHRVYSEAAGRVLDDNEVGLQYIKDQLNAWRRHVVNEDGTLNFKQLIHEGEWHMPSDIGEVTSIRPDQLAHELGYADAAALRRDVSQHVEKFKGEFVVVNGEHDLPWLEETLREQLGAHPDYVRRATAYFGETWDDFWHRLSRGVDEGGLDISSHYAKEAQDLIAGIAKERGMDPWEYLSGVMAVNIGPESLDTAMGRLVSFLKGGPIGAADGDWGAFFRSHLDPSAQQTLVEEWGRTAGTGQVSKEAEAQYAKELADYNVKLREWADEVEKIKAANQPAEDYVDQAVSEIASKWRASDTKNRLRMEKDLRKLEEQGYDIGEAEDALGDYEGIDRADFESGPDGREEYNDARQEAWDNILDKIEEIAPLEKPEPVYPTRPVEPVKPTAAAAAPALKPAEFTFKVPKSAPGKPARPAVAELPANFTQEPGYVYRVENPEVTASGWPERTGVTTGKPTSFYHGKGSTPEAIFRTKADDSALDVGRHGAGGADRLTKAHIPPEQIEMLTDSGWVALPPDPSVEFFNTGIIDMLKSRVENGVHPNPDVEAAIQQVSKLTQSVLKGAPAEGQTRSQLRSLVEAIPTTHASPFNRSQALIVSLLKNKIEDAQQDVFRLAEMQTQRSVLERSLNHPLFGLYPASYMWGKVLPETVKFLARNPYAATYGIADVQRAIAIQREYDRELDDKVGSVDRSAGAFLLDYLTPGLPWSAHDARLSPLVRDILGGKDLGKMWSDEIGTISPQRWVQQIVETLNEVPGAVESLGEQPAQPPAWQGALSNLPSASPSDTGGAGGSQITGPTKASALAPILADDLSRLQSILLAGESPDE